jgi:hypothetical protein
MRDVVIITAAITAFLVGFPLVLYALHLRVQRSHLRCERNRLRADCNRLQVERDAARDLIQREVDAVATGIAEHLAKEKRRGEA